MATPEEQFDDHTDPNISIWRLKAAIVGNYLLAMVAGAAVGALLAYLPGISVLLLFLLIYRGIVAVSQAPNRGFPKSVVASSQQAEDFFRRHRGHGLTAVLVAIAAMVEVRPFVETPEQVAAKTQALREAALKQEMNDFPKRIPQIHGEIAAIDALLNKHNLAAAMNRWKDLQSSMLSIRNSPMGGYADVLAVQGEINQLKARIDESKKQQVSSQDYHMSQYLLGQLDNIDGTMKRGRWLAAGRSWASLQGTINKMRPEVSSNLPGMAAIRSRMDAQHQVIRQALSGHPPVTASEQKPRRRTYSAFP